MPTTTVRPPTEGATAPVIDPRTGRVIRRQHLHDLEGAATVARAAAAAAAPWAATPLDERAALVERIAAALEDQAGAALPGAFSREHGKTEAEARAELDRAVATLRWAAADGRSLLVEERLADREGLGRVVHAEPAGPVLGIVPWNFPAVITARKLGPALVAGCPVVVVGPPDCPSPVAAFATAAAAAGAPPGLVQVVFVAPPVAEALVGDHRIAHVSFTGSTAVGRRVAAAAAAGPTPCTLELGGHAPAIVTADADLDRAVPALVAAKFGSTGQSCGAPSRLLVARSLHDAFVERFVAALPALESEADTGRPAMGPLHAHRRRAAVHDLVVDAVARGAVLRAGGVLPPGDGFAYPATVLTEVPPGARVMGEEPFGPIAPVVAFDDEDEAVALANGTDLALSAYVFGADERAVALAGRIDAGSVMVNAVAGAAPDAPLGGRRHSGYGYEGGAEGLLAFCRLKVVHRRVEGSRP
jgi:succinate-semialdehyde dehydrogenase/glutarate-semialdehyde dehydrogenase